MVFVCLNMVDFYGFHVGKYTSPMDFMGMDSDGRVESQRPVQKLKDPKRQRDHL